MYTRPATSFWAELTAPSAAFSASASSTYKYVVMHEEEDDGEDEEVGDSGAASREELAEFLPPELLDAPRAAQDRYLLALLDKAREAEAEYTYTYCGGLARDAYLAAVAERYAPTRELAALGGARDAAAFAGLVGGAWLAGGAAPEEALAGGRAFRLGGFGTPRLRELLLAEAEAFERFGEASGLGVHRPNSMNHAGVVLDDCGLAPALDALVSLVVRPLAARLLPEFGGASLDSHHGFVVAYGSGADVDLGFHVDDSDVTLNLCLTDGFEGGDLFLRGTRCPAHQQTPPRPGEQLDVAHAAGDAILHPGRLRHGARATTSGRRVNLIVWCRSSSLRAAPPQGCPAWCGEHAAGAATRAGGL